MTRPRRGEERQRAPRDQAPPGAGWRTLAGIALLVVTTSVAYRPCLQGGFILDDNVNVTENQLIKAPDGLLRFWTTADAVDYWPVTNSSLWLEWRLWGMNPTGYHATNLLLHIATALLLWTVLARLAIPGAPLAAALFALHPLNVESVAWITQRKNLLALAFSLAATLWYLKSETRSPPAGQRAPQVADRWFWLSLAAFVLAMLSKASVAIFPMLLLAIVWWRHPLTARDAVRIGPFLLVSAVLILVNMSFQARFVANLPPIGLTERLLGAGAAVWFYLAKALLPLNLSFVYPKWHIRTDQLIWWLPLLAAGATTGALWWCRLGWGRPLLLAWVFFCVSLAPVMGFTNVGFMEHSLVADHYQHVALIGVVALVAAGWDAWRQRAHGPTRWVPNGVAIAACAVLALLTWRQSALYTDAITLYRATLVANPDSPFVHNNLGLALLDATRQQDAIEQFEHALRLKPEYPEAHFNLGRTLLEKDRVGEAIAHYQEAARLKPYLSEYRYHLGTALARNHQFQEAIDQFEQALRLFGDSPAAHNNLGGVLLESGRAQEAIEHYERALRLDPDFAAAHANLAKALRQVGRHREAIEHFAAVARLNPDSPGAHNDLGVALADAGRLTEAVDHFQAALRLEPDDRNAQANLEEVRAMMEKATAN